MANIMATMDRNRAKRYIWEVLLSLFASGAVIAAIWFGAQIYRQHQAEKQMTDLAEQTNEKSDVHAAEADNAGGAVPEGTAVLAESVPVQESSPFGEGIGEDVPIPEKEIDFLNLTENVNPDIYAWIYIPDTVIDYPVLQHPDNNNYYLKHNLDGSKGYPGCIYTENYNAKDFTDPNTVLYGHNMKNGTMFAGLHKYEDSTYFEEHPYIYIYTQEKLYVYEIFAAYEYSNEHLLLNYDLTDEFIYKNYLEEIQTIRSMNSNWKEDVEVTEKNHILTLSTCVADKPDHRYLVQGVLLNED